MKRSVKILWITVFSGIGAFVLLLLLFNFRIIGSIPALEDLENPQASLASEVIADDGTILGKYYMVDRSNSDYKDISPNVINALIATEDRRFYDHSGIDPWGTAAIPFYLAIGKKRGSSTITQQLALNLQLDQSGNTRSKSIWTRSFQKLQEWIMAVKLERNFTKQEIITLYLNTVAFGDNVYGIENGARTFFSKDAAHLSVAEAATLVGMLKGNTLYNPRRNPVSSLNRRNTVIDNMVKAGFITPAQGDQEKSAPIALHYNKIDHNNGMAPYFREVLRDEIKDWAKNNKKNDGSPYNIYRDGLKIYTTINPRMQLYAEEAVAQHLKDLQKSLFVQGNIKSGKVWDKRGNDLEKFMKESDRYKNMPDDATDEDIKKSFNTPTKMKVFAWRSFTDPSLNEIDTVMTPMDSIRFMREYLQTGFMAMDPESGEVKAWVGGPDFRYFKNDHVKNTRRQVGSTFKPFLYTFAIMNGMSPNTMLPNEPITIGKWTLNHNAEGGVGGDITMAGALAQSLNLVSAYLIKQLTPQAVADFANNKIGFGGKVPPYPSIALGTPELSLFEMLQAYTMFPGRGVITKPIYITRIEDRNGNILETFAPEKREVISETEAYTMVKMMEGVVAPGGTAARARFRYNLKGEMAGKTGTTNDNTDGWFLGYTPQLLAGAWVGCENNYVHFATTAMGQGANTGLPIWAYFMQKVYADKSLKMDDGSTFPMPPGMHTDIQLNVEGNVTPGAESDDQGNGTSEQYLDVSDYGEQTQTPAPKQEDKKPEDKKPATPPTTPAPKAVMPGKKDQ